MLEFFRFLLAFLFFFVLGFLIFIIFGVVGGLEREVY